MIKDFRDKLSEIYSISLSNIDMLLSHMKIEKFSKGDFNMREGQYKRNLYIIKKGVIRSFRENDGEEFSLWFASEGEVVIQVWGYCKNHPSQENFECETDCELYMISKKETED